MNSYKKLSLRPELSEKLTPGPIELLTTIVRPDLDIIFVGAAPSHHAADTGHWYAGPRNRFYLLLHQAGFTERRLLPEEDELLPDYGIGLDCIHPDIASSANHLLPVPTEERREDVKKRLLTLAPKIVCYNGKDVFRLCTGRTCLDWGEQSERLGSSLVFVVISTSGRADRHGAERLALFQELKALVDLTKK